MEETILKDDNLFLKFQFCASEAGADTGDNSLVRRAHLVLTKKMVHSHGNEVVQNRALLGHNFDDPLMLREELKVIAVKKVRSEK